MPSISDRGPARGGLAGPQPVALSVGAAHGELAPTDTRPRGRRGRPRRRTLLLGLVALLLVGSVAMWAWWPGHPADIRAGTTLVDAEGLAARYGIDVTLVGVTAAGGIIDFRYQVVDPDKANPIIHDIALFPKLINEKTGATIALRTLPHNHKRELELGGTYFFLLANSHDALAPGARVTLVIGDTRLEHIPVKG